MKNLGPPKGFFVEESHVLAYFVAAKCWQLDTQDYFGHESEVCHGWKWLWSLFEQHCILRVAHVGAAWARGLPNPRELTCLWPIQELPRDADNQRVLCMHER